MLSRFLLIPERHGRTDGQTDGQNCYINIARQYADARYKLTDKDDDGSVPRVRVEIRSGDE